MVSVPVNLQRRSDGLILAKIERLSSRPRRGTLQMFCATSTPNTPDICGKISRSCDDDVDIQLWIAGRSRTCESMAFVSGARASTWLEMKEMRKGESLNGNVERELVCLRPSVRFVPNKQDWDKAHHTTQA